MSGRGRADVAQTVSKLLWTSDGASVMTAMGWTNTINKRFFFKPGTPPENGESSAGSQFVVEDSADASLWYNINTEGFDWLEIHGEFNMVEKGALTAQDTQQTRMVALGQTRFVTDPDFFPWQVKANPLTNFAAAPSTTADTVSLGHSVMRGFADTAPAGNLGYEPYPRLDGGAKELGVGLHSTTVFANGRSEVWSLAVQERASYDSTISVIRKPFEGVKHTGQVFIAICINAGTNSGGYTTTRIKGNVWATLSREGP